MEKLVAIVALALAVAGCGDTGNVLNTLPEAAEGTSTASVDIDEFAFGPDSLLVMVGTEVTWRHSQSGIPHTVTADEGSWAGTDSGTLQEGATFSYTFSAAGSYTYICSIHSSMTGTVIVTG